MTKTEDSKLTTAHGNWRKSNEEFRTALKPYQASHDLQNLDLILRMTQEQAEDMILQHLSPQ